MPRFKEYVRLESTDEFGGLVKTTIAINTMYGIKHRDKWVGKIHYDVVNRNRRYHKMFYGNKVSAQTQCDKLNDMFDSIEYRVVELQEFGN
tara:strand:+ start:154 stop:426 length:273 start_codon:yes stop_codon:yes gene_type:complete